MNRHGYVLFLATRKESEEVAHRRRKMLKVEGAQKVIARENFEPRPLSMKTRPFAFSMLHGHHRQEFFLDIAMKVSIRTDFAATIS